MITPLTETNKNIIDFINTSAENIKEEDLDTSIVPKLLEHYSSRINYLAFRAYGQSGTNNSVALGAFKERSKEELRKGLRTFLFTSEHWKRGRDINSYLLTCLNYLADRLKNDATSTKKINIPICPGCRHLGNKEFLTMEDKSLRCLNCTNEFERLSYESKDTHDLNSFEQKIQIHKIFALHSRKGWRCDSCNRFIPDSQAGQCNISCPYPDCAFFGKTDSLKQMAHPVALGARNNLSLDDSFGGDDKGKSTGWDIWQDKLKSREINADVQMAVQEQFDMEFNAARDIIEVQKLRVKNSGLMATCIQKTLMYQAYENMLVKYPEEMVSYLVHLKQNSDFPIQSRIFQEYVSLIRDALPFTIVKGGSPIDIISLTDPNLGLFTGISTFDAVIQVDGTIPNNTVETYTGGRKARYRGQCFLGMIIDIKDKLTGLSILNKMNQYSFVKIKMNKNVVPGTEVEVSHFRLIPHYEMGNLVYLQRIRRKIVDSIYFKMNGKKREVRKFDNSNEG